MAYCQAAGQDANELPYGNIVGFNEHAAVLHYTEMGRKAGAAAAQLLIDAGASARLRQRHHPHLRYAGHDEFAGDDRRRRRRPAADVRRRRARRHRQRTCTRTTSLMGVLKDFGVIACRRRPPWRTGQLRAFLHGWYPDRPQVHDVAGFAASDEGGRSSARKAIRTCA
jgi:Xaa-Pro dipeptidase